MSLVALICKLDKTTISEFLIKRKKKLYRLWEFYIRSEDENLTYN